MVTNPPANAGDMGFNPCQEDPLEKEMVTHSSILDWKIPWTEEPDGLQSKGLQKVGQDLASKHNNNNCFYQFQKEKKICLVIYLKYQVLGLPWMSSG